MVNAANMGHVGTVSNKEIEVTKYLMLKHYRGPKTHVGPPWD